MMEENRLILAAKKLAIKLHTKCGQMYSGYPYYVHLKHVDEIAKYFIHLIPEEERPDVLAACWLHDTIEDCAVTYNDIKDATNERVADMVYALTNEKGKNRKERANAKYYDGINEILHGPFVKMVDRLANIEFSINEECKELFKMYKSENQIFLEKLDTNDIRPLVIKLKDLLKEWQI